MLLTPAELNNRPNIATPVTPPICRAQLKRAEAEPADLFVAWPRTRFVITGIANDVPLPSNIMGIYSCVALQSGEINITMPNPIRLIMLPSSDRLLTESQCTNHFELKLTSAVNAIIGIKARPVSRAERCNLLWKYMLKINIAP